MKPKARYDTDQSTTGTESSFLQTVENSKRDIILYSTFATKFSATHVHCGPSGATVHPEPGPQQAQDLRILLESGIAL